jgi:RNA polymerase sigma factor (sigma-70 family)
MHATTAAAALGTGTREVTVVDGPNKGPHPLESTASLLQRAQAGDLQARDALAARYLPILSRWAHGRLPAPARDLLETDDLVQVSLLKALNRVEGFEYRREGAFLAYLRQILVNEVRQEIRRTKRRPAKESLKEEFADHGESALERVLGREVLAKYETALATLDEREREAVILRIEFGFTHEQVAAAIDSPSANAARMTVKRALLALAAEMDRGTEGR